jgi:uncharacterized protein YjbI with pentapeptide repeats
LAEEWSKRGKKRGYLLQGRQLDDAKNFQKRYADQLPLSGLAVNLVRRSLRQRWVNWAMVASLATIPLIAVEGFLREEAVKRNYTTLAGDNSAVKRQAVVALVEGCAGMRQLSERLPYRILWLLRPVGERLYGNCRPLWWLNLKGVDLRRIYLRHGVLNNSDLRNADLRDAYLGNAYLRDADLRGANFSGTGLRHADLGRADLRDAKNLTIEQLSQAKLCETTLPEGVNLDPTRNCKEMDIPL